ncbi:PfkB family carbohydrate kinase [Prosthecobacter dejongeii]|uniref:Sugar/nucleoside kinase (Ribokinase family) n=1 Tax=Prosthecobacter dejongeii TaxID=48465 RepID=A0A7W7YN80_9BACT|nr:sugar/nucleoside kinase (ribokinase family) [Prosthecobacter dejongeii]
MTFTAATTPIIEVIGIGAATQDDLWLVPEFSDQEGVTEAFQHLQMGGGPVATALCVLGCLGRSAALFDVVGGDTAGQRIMADLQRHKVSTEAIELLPTAISAQAVILVRKGDGARQITYLPSNAGELKLQDHHRERISKARLLHINGRHEAAARQAVKLATEANVLISFDGGAGRYRDSIRDLVLRSHIRIVSWQFAEAFCQTSDVEEMFLKLLNPPALVVVITQGTQGSWLAMPNGWRFHQPAYSASPLLDSTGCGDVYHGAFLHGWLAQWTPQECSDFASLLAAKNAEGLGGRRVCELLACV